jgi:hypothetical protein
MKEAAEKFLDDWLIANVSRKHCEQPSADIIKALAQRCLEDATAAGISLESRARPFPAGLA